MNQKDVPVADAMMSCNEDTYAVPGCSSTIAATGRFLAKMPQGAIVENRFTRSKGVVVTEQSFVGSPVHVRFDDGTEIREWPSRLYVVSLPSQGA